ncbi:MAG TPA: tRNA uridine-5-carboxymethylaminomethyl(34) synthesis enzyme MnmG, partial [Plasticicumulans sp.]|nr:tRNA uridine-5-carboxymethylaminomethyl(34) synthesis enzyme MnmG [Plasticicumulans sp.]
ADLRLTETGRRLGLVGDVRWAAFEARREAIERETQRLRECWVRPAALDPALAEAVLGGPLARETRALDLLRRPELDHAAVLRLAGLPESDLDADVIEQVEIQAGYAGYIERAQADIARARRQEDAAIPAGFDYAGVRGLSSEVREKLARVRPDTVGQAGRIPGVTPAAVSLLLVHLKRLRAAG